MSLAVQMSAAARVMTEELGFKDFRELATSDADKICRALAKQFSVDEATVKATLLHDDQCDPDDLDPQTIRRITQRLCVIAESPDDHLAARVGLGLLEHQRSKKQHTEKMKMMAKSTAPVLVINNLIQQAFKKVQQFDAISHSDSGRDRILQEALATPEHANGDSPDTTAGVGNESADSAAVAGDSRERADFV